MKKIIILFTVIVFLASCNNNGNGGWARQDEEKWMNSCMNQLQGNPRAKEICSCVLQKAEKAFPTYMEEETKGTAEQGAQWTQECLNGNNRNGGGILNNNNNNTINRDDNNNQGGNWTNQQRQQYTQECANGLLQSGWTAQQANSYCDCMTRKVEQKFSFREANQLTAADLETDEWKQAIEDCKPRY